LIEKKNFPGEPIEHLYTLYEIRLSHSKIIYQRRIDVKERILEVYDRWAHFECSDHMRFMVTKNPSKYFNFLFELLFLISFHLK